jgi:myosin-5
MTDLVFLHEPGVLHNLKQRYSSNAIYTYTGSILIAVNPFKALPGLYEKRVMDAYSSGATAGLPPHVYAIAGAAYKKMRLEGKGQAILVSSRASRGLGWGMSCCAGVVVGCGALGSNGGGLGK